jgi:hypothetical protein
MLGMPFEKFEKKGPGLLWRAFEVEHLREV